MNHFDAKSRQYIDKEKYQRHREKILAKAKEARDRNLATKVDIDKQVDQWNETLHYLVREKLCEEIGDICQTRSVWRLAHRASYKYAMSMPNIRKPDIIRKRKKLEDGFSGRIQRIADARSEIHRRCQVPGGFGIEREAGNALTAALKAELPIDTCIRIGEDTMRGLAERYLIKLLDPKK